MVKVVEVTEMGEVGEVVSSGGGGSGRGERDGRVVEMVKVTRTLEPSSPIMVRIYGSFRRKNLFSWYDPPKGTTSYSENIK